MGYITTGGAGPKWWLSSEEYLESFGNTSHVSISTMPLAVLATTPQPALAPFVTQGPVEPEPVEPEPAEPEPAEPEPAEPEPAEPEPAGATQFVVGDHIASRDELETAVALLSAATGNSVRKILAKAEHPLATVDYHTIAKDEFALDPTLAHGPAKTKTAFIRHLNRGLHGDPGPFPIDDAGFCVPLIPARPVTTTGEQDLGAYMRDLGRAFGDGRIIGRGYSSLSTGAVFDWVVRWCSGDLKGAYQLETVKHPLHPGGPAYPKTHKVIWQPAVAGEVPAGVTVAGDWASPQAVWSTGPASAYLIAANMAHPTHLSGVDRTRWVKAHLRAAKNTVDILSLKAQARAEDPLHLPLSHPPDPGPPPVQPPLESFLEGNMAVAAWSIKALDEYLTTNKIQCGWRWNDRVDAAQAHRATNKAPEHSSSSELSLVKAPDQPDFGGYHRKLVLTDQYGRTWLFKPAPTPDARFRPEVEHAAHELARIWGFRTAHSQLVTFDGQYGQIQLMLAVKRDLLGVSGAGFADLTAAQLTAVAVEHLLDWALDNDDTHGSNIVILADGDAIGIDKGRAWRYLGGWDGLSGTTAANSNAQLVYTALYAAIAAGHLPADVVDAMYRAVIVKARYMQALPDDILRDHLVQATANRPHYQPSSYQKVVPGAPTNAEELIAQVVARKHNLVTDMLALWSRVYERAERQPPNLDFPLGFNPQGHEIHAGLHSPALHDAVTRTKSYGTPAFVAGTGVEDAHVLLWRERRPDGNFNIRGQFKARAAAYTAMAAWCACRSGQPGSDTAVAEFAMAWHLNILNAVKATTANAAGQPVAFSKDNIKGTRHQLGLYLMQAESTLDAGNSADIAAVCHTYLTYLDIIDTHLENGTEARVGDFPAFEWHPQPLPEQQDYTVEYLFATRAAASGGNEPCLDPVTGELHLNGDDLVGEGATAGRMYLSTLPTGEQIEFRAGSQTATPLTIHGLVQFTIPADDLAAGLHRVCTHLAAMGCPLQPATGEDLELYYWRHLHAILGDRCDTGVASYASGIKEFWERCAVPGTLTVAQYRHAFAALTNVEQIATFTAHGAHLPQFPHPDLRQPGQPAGKPYWLRFDVGADQWTKRDPLATRYNNGPRFVLDTGVSLAAEARTRTLAIWKSGQSSVEDFSRGSGAYIFTRQNRALDCTNTVLFSPRLLTRTSTYTLPSDYYGRLSIRKKYAPYLFGNAVAFGDCANEAMVRECATLLDDIEALVFTNTAMIRTAVHGLARHGIAIIRSRPVTERFHLTGHVKLSHIIDIRSNYTRR